MQNVAVIVPLSLMGVGFARMADISQGRALLQEPMALQMAGLDESTSSQISWLAGNGKLQEAETALREGYKKIDFKSPEVIARRAEANELYRQQNEARVEAMQRLTASGVLPDMRRTESGWQLRYEDGATADYGNYIEADAARWDLPVARMLNLSAATRETIRNSERNLAVGEARAFRFDARDMTVRLYKSENPHAENDLEQRMEMPDFTGKGKANFRDNGKAEERAYHEMVDTTQVLAPDQDTRDATTLILGTSAVEMRERVFTKVATLYQGFTPATIVEETLEGDAVKLLQNGKRDWLIGYLQEIWPATRGPSN